MVVLGTGFLVVWWTGFLVVWWTDFLVVLGTSDSSDVSGESDVAMDGAQSPNLLNAQSPNLLNAQSPSLLNAQSPNIPISQTTSNLSTRQLIHLTSTFFPLMMYSPLGRWWLTIFRPRRSYTVSSFFRTPYPISLMPVGLPRYSRVKWSNLQSLFW